MTVAFGCSLAFVGCGKRGAPLPPLVRIPAAPANLTAERRGAQVDLHFTVPAANIDGTKPGNVERVDVYAYTGPASVAVPDNRLLEHATRIASVPVKAPRDPNQTVEAGEPPEDVEPPQGVGLDQGATARVSEELTAAALEPTDFSGEKDRTGNAAEAKVGPLLGPSVAAPTRTYLTVGISTNGRKGPLSSRIAVPLVPPPPPPSAPTVSYDETAITVTWTLPGWQPLTSDTPAKPAAAPVTPADTPAKPTDAAAAPTEALAEPAGVLPSRPIGPARPAIAFHVYDAASPTAVRLTTAPLAATRFTDNRVEWGAERCYAVRAIETVDGLTIESDAQPPTCKKLVDTFPPAAPKGLTAVATEGAISLIWDPNNEKDLAGYVVLRGVAPAEKLDVITPAPFSETTFKDGVKSGVHFVYAVQAVDKAGNASAMSNRVEETAR